MASARFTAAMKMLLPTILAVALISSGCGLFKKEEPVESPPPPIYFGTSGTNLIVLPPPVDAKLIVTPGSGVLGRVTAYNDAGHFVILDFPIGHVPANGQRMFIYRNGLKVGEAKITGPQNENHIVADLAEGEAQKGDEVRDK
jgi:hypothetical protein